MKRVSIPTQVFARFVCLFASACASAPPAVQPTTLDTPPVSPSAQSFIADTDVLAAVAAPAAGTAHEELVPLNVHRTYIRALVADPMMRYFIAVDDDAVLSL